MHRPSDDRAPADQPNHHPLAVPAVPADLAVPPDTGDERSAAIGAGKDFEAIYHRYRSAVYVKALYIVGADLALDVTQETFLRFWRAPQLYDSTRGSVWALLSTIAHHTALDMLRQNTARQRREHRYHGRDITIVSDDVGTDVDPDRVFAAIEKLAPIHRQVILSIAYSDVSYQHAAASLGIPEGTMKSRMRSAPEAIAANARPGGMSMAPATAAPATADGRDEVIRWTIASEHVPGDGQS